MPMPIGLPLNAEYSLCIRIFLQLHKIYSRYNYKTRLIKYTITISHTRETHKPIRNSGFIKIKHCVVGLEYHSPMYQTEKKNKYVI